MRKKLFPIGIFIMICLIFSFGKTEYVQAGTGYKVIYASSKEEKKSRTVGNTIFEFDFDSYKLYAVKNGKRMLIASDRNLSPQILTDGKVVYYCINNYENCRATVYRVSSIGKKAKKLFATKMQAGFDFVSLYRGKIYYVKDIDPGKLCSYTLKLKREKVLVDNVTIAKQHKQYFYLTPYRGDSGPIPLRVYNSKNNKVKTISKGQINYYIARDYLYYAEVKKVLQMGYTYNVTIKQCSFNGGNRKTLVKNLDVQHIYEYL